MPAPVLLGEALSSSTMAGGALILLAGALVFLVGSAETEPLP